MSLDQISAELGIPRSTTYRLATTLCDAGFLERGGNARQYRLGLRSAALATAILRQRGSSALIHETLLWLEEQLGETVGISIRLDEYALIIDKVKSRHALAFDPSMGTKLPCFCTAAGRVLLVDHTDEEITKLIEPGIEAHTQYTKTDIRSILAEITLAREQGYAVDNQEWTAGLLCVAVPMRSASGKLTHALAVSAASARTPVENAHSLAVKLREATSLIEPLLTELYDKRQVPASQARN
jgi:DNA-binding IclR family transcriptional regulator